MSGVSTLGSMCVEAGDGLGIGIVALWPMVVVVNVHMAWRSDGVYVSIIAIGLLVDMAVDENIMYNLGLDMDGILLGVAEAIQGNVGVGIDIKDVNVVQVLYVEISKSV